MVKGFNLDEVKLLKCFLKALLVFWLLQSGTSLGTSLKLDSASHAV